MARYLICAGGTGGGVYPALAVLNAIRQQQPDAEFLWVGGEEGMEVGLVERAGLLFKAIPAAGLHGVSWQQLPGNLMALLRGFLQARVLVQEFQPDAMLFTGGYVAGPVALAGRKIPSLLYVPDIEPGLALKALARFASRIALTADESRAFFANQLSKLRVTGYPIRPELTNWHRAAARAQLNLKSDLPVLLFFGGSKGAHSINQAVLTHLEDLLKKMEVIHISGELDWPEVEQHALTLAPALAKRYHPFAYVHEEMGAALAAADLVVSRAGASALGEFPAFGLPAILVPYPHAWRYQKINAEYLTKRGAAILVEDAKLKSGLALTVEKLFETPEKLAAMQQAMQTLYNPQAAAQLAAHLMELAGGRYG
ncbi:MAG: undecaprenyldiphospho-muramoylpentapeptide beta-N-acetylglucosaminyltransferase [Anaerolineae bacterium CG_4_9_14_3_um_filter_57_17]|nr:undecaprenyldiphospho-muramoylpentapeptide beta-N-acetylglucosaminyltransferase [bacterium]NCT21459.1 undecaprenyldiphospho-muramoylpentapeptide beta-N-acetylglucosaminyltransferase [bacterium]OIO86590.1 MAG: undecaprenyldiphospho-muramoylpentapeptide beta-N-acetylglucosaminyltransferase [Anaerolineae bacterium CG2_30_57_67]PJB68193.1 MAG: undecaprenyldiphospho-muramoylpentapeptide beta-N-acetylglucosaminyltransferase [Anaerolineae bacterium CG_4_9_14_3_um_filter_57_17]